MIKLILLASFLIPITTFAQTLYVNPSCKDDCKKCLDLSQPFKVTYKVDIKTNKIFRTINDKNPIVFSDCTVIDENNWTCEGIAPNSNYGKQYAVNGVAHWNDSSPNYQLDKETGAKFSCRYSKSIFGKYSVLDEVRKY